MTPVPRTLKEFYDLIRTIRMKLKRFGFHKWSQILYEDMVSGTTANEILGLLKQDLIRLDKSAIALLLCMRRDIRDALGFIDSGFRQNRFR